MAPDVAEPAPDQEEPPSRHGKLAPCPVVGIGASAGGLDALQRLFAAVPADCGLAFVVVQHLDPDHKSVLAEVIGRSTALAVTPIEDGAAVEPSHAYVIPPDTSLTIEDAVLHLARPDSPRGRRTPIDEFFISLAKDQGENAACVILSGTGSDGTLGLRAIKENNGLTLAQAEAAYDGMMRSAVATGLVDYVLTAEDIASKLISYFGHVTRFGDGESRANLQAEAAGNLNQISGLLRTHTGNDFSGYKERTFTRRVQRRMQVLQLDRVPEYIDRLRRDPGEVRMLFQDMLIGVTNFFRDPEVFAALSREVIPHISDGKRTNDVIRVWVPGCSTGEEAYTIAMLLREAAPKTHGGPKLQVFASDIDDRALDLARIGRYPAAIANDVPPKLLDRYFLREDGTWRIATELREICLFSNHNLLRDAPFSRLDLVSCRNVMIYLTAELQERVIPLFHYALRPGGYLVLGTSENVTKHGRLFSTVDKAHRIFRRRPQTERRVPDFPLTSPSGVHRRSVAPRHPPAELTLEGIAERVLLDRYAPPYVVINAEGDLLHSSGRTGRYLELPPGAPEINLFSMAKSGMRLELRAAVHKAMGSGRAATQGNVEIGTNGGRQEINLHVQPLRYQDTTDALFLVVFQEAGPARTLSDGDIQAVAENTEHSGVRQLESELRELKDRLQTTTEELESSNEELKSSNEELSSMNEELQSSNEELETSKEELQSINEELQTVNAELHLRVEELSRVNNDIANLLESTQIATVFLDDQLRVKSFTPAAKDVFRLVESDAGRPLTHVRARIDMGDLEEEAARVLRTLTQVERRVESIDDDTVYMMRILPYRTANNVISGVVLTFTDVTRTTVAEAKIERLTSDLRTRIGSLETLLELLPVGVLIFENEENSRILVNRGGARLLGMRDEGNGLLTLPGDVHLFQSGEEIAQRDHPLRVAARSGAPTPVIEAQVWRADGQRIDVMMAAAPLLDEQERPRGAIATLVDVSSHKRAEAHQRLLLHELQHRVKNILATVGSLAIRMTKPGQTSYEFRDAFLDRLAAMGRMHDLLSGGAWEGTTLRELLTASLDSYADGGGVSVAVEGPNVTLAPDQATSLGMVLHELTTNAVKYGSLSAPGGSVRVAWEVATMSDGASEVRLAWTESGGPAVSPPATRGFGTDFIERSVGFELQGRATLNFERTGLRCTITLPLRAGGGELMRYE